MVTYDYISILVISKAVTLIFDLIKINGAGPDIVAFGGIKKRPARCGAGRGEENPAE
jgi:hypothetical protein